MVRKERGLFDVMMGAYNGPQVLELVGIDEGLALLKNIFGPQAEKISKYFQNVLHKNNLSIIIKCNIKSLL